MSRTHPVWTGETWIDVPAAESDGEAVMVPNVNAVVYDGPAREHVLLQRRDKPGELVRGRLELPGGRWRAGELPDAAIVREVAEETGVRITAVAAAGEVERHAPHVATAIVRPVAVVAGVEGCYPSLHVVLECYGEGKPRPLPGETADPRWWPVAAVVELLNSDRDAFVWQAATALRASLSLLSRPLPH